MFRDCSMETFRLPPCKLTVTTPAARYTIRRHVSIPERDSGKFPSEFLAASFGRIEDFQSSCQSLKGIRVNFGLSAAFEASTLATFQSLKGIRVNFGVVVLGHPFLPNLVSIPERDSGKFRAPNRASTATARVAVSIPERDSGKFRVSGFRATGREARMLWDAFQSLKGIRVNFG